MSDIAIRVGNLGKRYRIGARRKKPRTRREALLGFAGAPFRYLRSSLTQPTRDEVFWALKDVSFEVKRGEVLGIVGRNGAGKSTLLKILSRITEPTEGWAELHGRVGSLLEVGSGFHPELTGRENIYLNGTILGMKKVEIDRKLDQIIAFAEVEKFIDTPVKYYSSGMHVRLAFAVAAHLEPEIVLVDEVLAVGDAAFQRKCLGKMGDVTKEGRTVLFVSHNMSAVETLCTSALLLEDGRVAVAGRTDQVVSHYLSRAHHETANPFDGCEHRGNGRLRVLSFRLESPDGQLLTVARSGAPTVFAFDFENVACGPTDRISFSFSVHDHREAGLFQYYSHFSGVRFQGLPPAGRCRCLISELPLAPGDYMVTCRVVMNGDQDSGEEVDRPLAYVPFTVVGRDFYGTGDAKLSAWGPILVKGAWSMVPSGKTP